MKRFIDHQINEKGSTFMVSRKKINSISVEFRGKVFKGEFKEERARQIVNDEEIVKQVETFASHFCRMQGEQEKSGALENFLL